MNGLPRLPRQSSGSGSGGGLSSGVSQRSSRRAALMLSDAPGSSSGADDAAAESLPFAAGGVAVAAAAASSLHSHMDDAAASRGGTARAGTRPPPLLQGRDASLSAPSTAAAAARSASPSPPPLAASASATAAESASAFPSTLKLRTSISGLANVSSGGPGGSSGSTPPSAPQAMQSVRTLHSSVQATLGSIQTKTSLILQEQERDLLRSFQTRLGEVVAELEKERKKNESGSIEWVQRCRKLTEELEWLRELTETLSLENKQLLLQNRRAARAAATQDQDRAFLIKQLVAVKKENARLRFLVEQQVAENQSIRQQQQQQMQQHQQGQVQWAQTQQAQLMPASGGNSLAPSPPLTQRTLAAHNGNSNVQSPKTKHALVSASLSPRRRSSSASAAAATAATAAAATAVTPIGAGPMLPLSLPQAPGNMRTSILAAATTEGGGYSPFPARPATTMGDYLPPTMTGASAAAAATAGVGGRAAGGAQTARLSTAPAATPGSHLSPTHHSLLPGPPLSSSTESRLKGVIASLKRRLDSEVVAHRAARAAYLAEVASRNQLQHLFKQCVDTVREQVAARKAQQQQQQQQHATTAQVSSPAAAAALRPGAPPSSLSVSTIPLTSLPPLDPRSVAYTELSEGDRLAIVEWMLSQRGVMMLLFDRTFPAGAAPPPPPPLMAQSHSHSQQPQQHSTSGLRHTQMFLPEGGPFPPANTVPLHYSYAHFAHPPKSHAHPHAHAQAHVSPPPPIRGTHEITPSVHVRAIWRPAASEEEEEQDEREHGHGKERADGLESRRSHAGDEEDEEDEPAQAVLYSSGMASAGDAADAQEAESQFGSLSIAAMIAGGGGGGRDSGDHRSGPSSHAQAPSGPVFIGHGSGASKSHRAPPMQVQRLMQQPNSARHHEAKE